MNHSMRLTALVVKFKSTLKFIYRLCPQSTHGVFFSGLFVVISDTVLVKLTNEVHSGLTRHICPLPGGQHLCTVLIVVGVVGLSPPPLAERGHGREVHVGEDPLLVQVVDPDVDSAQARGAYVCGKGRIGPLVLGHGQVAPPRLAVELGVGVALLLLHQQIDLSVCLFNASNSCRGGVGRSFRTGGART